MRFPCAPARVSSRDSYQSVYPRLEAIDSLQRLKDALTTDPRLNVTVDREPDYYAEQSHVIQAIIRTIGLTIARPDGVARSSAR